MRVDAVMLPPPQKKRPARFLISFLAALAFGLYLAILLLPFHWEQALARDAFNLRFTHDDLTFAAIGLTIVLIGGAVWLSGLFNRSK